jgi:hypothetical protein
MERGLILRFALCLHYAPCASSVLSVDMSCCTCNSSFNQRVLVYKLLEVTVLFYGIAFWLLETHVALSMPILTESFISKLPRLTHRLELFVMMNVRCIVSILLFNSLLKTFDNDLMI